jgi:hypothetical protein
MVMTSVPSDGNIIPLFYENVKKGLSIGECRGDPRSPAEKLRFSGFPKENNRIFRFAAMDFAKQNPRATTGRPYAPFSVGECRGDH